MKLIRIFLFSFLLIYISACKKNAVCNSCIDNTEKDKMVQTLAPLLQDTTNISFAERQLMNEIRVMANDINSLSISIDTSLPPQEYYDEIRINFSKRIDTVVQKASAFYNNSEPKIILAKNAFVLMTYDALQRNYPNFMWVQLGVFVAEDVRSGLVLALSLRKTFLQNNVHIPINGIDISDALLATCNELMNGQLNVLTDIGPFAIMNYRIGANKMKNETWLSPEAKQGYIFQEQAETALKTKDCNSFYDKQTEAAIQFGAHEQIYILQPMWNAPLMQQFSALNNLLVQLTQRKLVFFGDIFVGTNKITEANKGYTIKLPATITSLADAQQRITIAINGFNTLNSLRKNADWNYWLAYSQVKIGYYNGVYLPNVDL